MSQEETKVEEIPLDNIEEMPKTEDLECLQGMVDKDTQMGHAQGKMKKYNKMIKKIFSQEKMKPQQKVDQIIIQMGDKLIWVREPSVYKNNGNVYGFGGISEVVDVSDDNKDTVKTGDKENIETGKLETERKDEENIEEEIADIQLKEDDIMTVCDQANVDKEKAIEALKKYKGDVIEAIYSLE